MRKEVEGVDRDEWEIREVLGKQWSQYILYMYEIVKE